MLPSPPAVADGRDPAAAPAPPPLAAEYRVEQFEGNATQASGWRMWRTPQQLWRAGEDGVSSEQWQLDGRRTLFHTRYLHADRAGIAFQHEDLEMAGALPAWTQLTQLVAPELRAALPVIDRGEGGGGRWIHYRGERAGVQWDILWREDLLLPQRLERSGADGRRERLTLLGHWSLAQAPWQPPSVEDYRVIEFADLGDHERDPLVQRVQAQMGIGHAHGPPGGHEHEGAQEHAPAR